MENQQKTPDSKRLKKTVSSIYWDGTKFVDSRQDGLEAVQQTFLRTASVRRGFNIEYGCPELIMLAQEQVIEFLEPVLDFATKPAEVQLGVGDGTGQHFVKGSHETIKMLQEKLLRYEKIENALELAIRTLNRIPNQRTPEGKTYEIIKELETALGKPVDD